MEYRHGPIAIADSRTLVIPSGSSIRPRIRRPRDGGATVLEPEADPLASIVSPTGSQSRLHTCAARPSTPAI